MRIVIAIPWSRWTPTMALPKALWAQQKGHNYPKTQKVDKMIGKNFISGLLIMLRRPVYASDHFKCPRSVHRNYPFLTP